MMNISFVRKIRHNIRNKLGIITPDECQFFEWISARRYSIVKEYLEKRDININVRNEDGWTPLHVASFFGYDKIVEILLRYHADIKAKTPKGETALNLALNSYKYDTAIVLLEQEGIELIINEADENGRVPLHWAVRLPLMYGMNTHGYKQPSVLKKIIDFGVDLNVRDKKGITPAHLAAYTGNLTSLKILRDAGADLSVKTNKGSSVLDVAFFNEDNILYGEGRKECIKFLTREKIEKNDEKSEFYLPRHKIDSEKFIDKNKPREYIKSLIKNDDNE